MITGKDKIAARMLSAENVRLWEEIRRLRGMLDEMLDSVGGTAGGWIKTGDMMPEENECVLGIVDGKVNGIEYKGVIAFTVWDGSEWYMDDFPDAETDINVSHWMEVPKKPRGWEEMEDA